MGKLIYQGDIMPSQISAALETRPDLADAVRQTDRILMPMLLGHSQGARALWHTAGDTQGRDVLTLVITDPWGYSSADFAPTELSNEERLRERFYNLIGEMIAPSSADEHRERIDIRDDFVSATQLVLQR
jgi:hypothetical protein